MLDPPTLCARCQRRRADTLDHDPPLAMHAHRQGSGCCRLIPCCTACNASGGAAVALGTWRPNVVSHDIEAEDDRERDGLSATDRRWRVPWLGHLRDIPDDATWPRLMTVPHPRAVGSIGSEFIAWAEERSGRPLRWWQRLVATRLLEVDEAGALVWEAMILSTARQVGKSWLLRELLLWRVHQGERFGEPQDVLHTGRDLAICKEVQRPARVWAKARETSYRVREVNGQEEIELLADGSRWMLRAREAVYGYSVSLAAADEAWKVKASSIDEGLTPTMVERTQPQLALVSTAHRLATSLMLTRRAAALEHLEDGGADLLIEWSAPQDAELDDRTAWRAASPHWGPRRERMIAGRLDAALTGHVDDVDEVDPIASFRAQWLNQWPRRIAPPSGATELLLPEGAWEAMTEEGATSTGPLWVALEDDYGQGAAVAAIGRTEDGRLEVGGWLRDDWDAAVADVAALADDRGIRRLLVGASLMDRTTGMRPKPAPAGGTETRHGLVLVRDLVAAGELVHDSDTLELDTAMIGAQVRPGATGLLLAARGPTHLVRAVAWALTVAHRPAKVPAVH